MKLNALLCLFILVSWAGTAHAEPDENPFYEENLELYQEALAVQGSVEVAVTAHTRDDATDYGERHGRDAWPVNISALDMRFSDCAGAIYDINARFLGSDRLGFDGSFAGDHTKARFQLARQHFQNVSQNPASGAAWNLARHEVQFARLDTWFGKDREFAVGVSEYYVDREPFSLLAVNETTRKAWADYRYKRGDWSTELGLWLQRRDEPQTGLGSVSADGMKVGLAWHPAANDRLEVEFKRTASDTADMNVGELSRNDLHLGWRHRFGSRHPLDLRAFYDHSDYDDSPSLNSRWDRRERYGMSLRTSTGDLRLLELSWVHDSFDYTRLAYEDPGVGGIAFTQGLTRADYAPFYDLTTVNTNTWLLRTKVDLGRRGAWFAGNVSRRCADDALGSAPAGTIALRRDETLAFNALLFVPLTSKVSVNLSHTYFDWSNGPGGGSTALFGAALDWAPCPGDHLNVRYNHWNASADLAAAMPWETDQDSFGATYRWETDGYRAELFGDMQYADGAEENTWLRIGGEIRWGHVDRPWRFRVAYTDENVTFYPQFDNSDLEILLGYTFTL